MSTTAITFRVESDPRPCARPQVKMRRGKGGKMIPIALKDDRDVEAQAQVAEAFRDALATYSAGWPLEPDRAYQVHLTFARGNYRRADADNLMKTVLDGLTGLAWLDDSQAIRGTWTIDYWPRRADEPPYTSVTVRRLAHTWRGEHLPLDPPQTEPGTALPLTP